MSTKDLLDQLHTNIETLFASAGDTIGRHGYAVRFLEAAVEEAQAYLMGTGPRPTIQLDSPVTEHPHAIGGLSAEDTPRFISKLAADAQDSAPPPGQPWQPYPDSNAIAAPQGWPITPFERQQRQRIEQEIEQEQRRKLNGRSA